MSRKDSDSRLSSRGENFRKMLRKAREGQGLSQNDLAVKAKVPLDTLRSIETGRINAPNLFLAADLVKALRGNLDRWIKGIDEEV